MAVATTIYCFILAHGGSLIWIITIPVSVDLGTLVTLSGQLTKFQRNSIRAVFAMLLVSASNIWGSEMHEGKTTIAVVDDHPVVVEGARMVFLAEPGFDVVATGGTAGDATRIATTLAPDVMLMDLSMPGEVFSAITHISQTTPTKIVVFTAYSSLDSALRALDAGALGFVLKGASFDEVLKAVQFALNGDLYIAQQYASQVMLALRARGRADVDAPMRLNIREKQIVNQLLHAKTNREIAATLHLSEKTVKRYMTVLMQKLHARNRVEVAIHAQRHEHPGNSTAEAARQ